MTTVETDEKSVVDSVFSNSSEMEADSAASGTEAKAEAPPAATPETEPKPEQIAKAEEVKDDEVPLQGRDPNTGRFVPVTELVAERKKLKEARDQEAKLRTEAEARAKAFEDQVAQLTRQFQQFQQPQQPQQRQEPQQVPDPILDPEGFARYQQHLMDVRFADMRVNMSEKYARMKHTDAVVDAALQAAHQSGIAHRFIEASDPFEALIGWHRKRQVEAEIGSDFEAFKKKVAEEAVQKALANLKAGGQAAPLQAQPQRFPSTLADHTAQGEQGSVLTSEAAINDVFANKRRA